MGNHLLLLLFLYSTSHIIIGPLRYKYMVYMKSISLSE